MDTQTAESILAKIGAAREALLACPEDAPPDPTTRLALFEIMADTLRLRERTESPTKRVVLMDVKLEVHGASNFMAFGCYDDSINYLDAAVDKMKTLLHP